MAKVKKQILPKDRTGQKFRCYRVVRTIPGESDYRFHLLKCSKCGAQKRSHWDETKKIFCPLPCDCGNYLFSDLKVGDVRNNKKVLEIKVKYRDGVKHYKVLVKCLNCGAMSTVRELSRLTTHKGKPQKWCEYCKGDALRVDYTGRVVGTWEVTKDEKESMTCKCIKCGDRIVLPRKHINTLKKRLCPKCLKDRKKVDRNKIMYVLFYKGYSYKSIGEYYGITVSSVKEVVDRLATQYEGP
jgi:Zn finger protein HypA/HybF involved in hydrogenase expression